MFKLLAIFFSFSVLSVVSDPNSPDCSWCRMVLSDATDHFNDTVSTTTNLQFYKYFNKQCPKYDMRSMNEAFICGMMYTHFPLVVFKGLRQQEDRMFVCQKCGGMC